MSENAPQPQPEGELSSDSVSPAAVTVEEPFAFTDEREAKFQEYVRRYPTAYSAIMPTLWLCQDQWGWLEPGMPEWVASKLGVPVVRVYQLITFYTMYYLENPGRFNLQVCRNISCHLMGAQKIVGHIKERLGLEVGQTSDDGMWRLEEVECLGACGYGPMLQMGKHYYENLTPEKVNALIDEWSSEASGEVDGSAGAKNGDGGADGAQSGNADGADEAGATTPPGATGDPVGGEGVQA